MLAFILALLGIAAAHAQPVACPPGVPLNPNRVIIGTGPCNVAGGSVAVPGVTVAPLVGGIVPLANLPPALGLTLGVLPGNARDAGAAIAAETAAQNAANLAQTQIVTETARALAAEALALPAAKLGAALGAAPLDSSSYVPISNINPSIVGSASHYVGTWNATTNTPTLTSSVAPASGPGSLYTVTVAGTTTLNGNGPWSVGDQAIWSGVTNTWSRLPAVFPVASVAGKTGIVTLAVTDVTGAAATTYVDAGDAANAAAITAEAATARGAEGTLTTSVSTNVSAIAAEASRAIANEATKASISSLAAVATSGNYTDLTGKPAPLAIGTAAGTARDAAAAIAAESTAQAAAVAAQATASAALPAISPILPAGLAGAANGAALLDANAKVLIASLINRPTIAPLTTTVGTGVTTVFPVGVYLSIRLALAAPGSLACTGDGTTPALGGTGTIAFGQDLHWPVQAGGAMPAAAVSCIAAASSMITTEAH